VLGGTNVSILDLQSSKEGAINTLPAFNPMDPSLNKGVSKSTKIYNDRDEVGSKAKIPRRSALKRALVDDSKFSNTFSRCGQRLTPLC